MSNTTNNQENGSTFMAFVKVAVGLFLLFVGSQGLFAQSNQICYTVDEFDGTKSFSSDSTVFYEDGGDMKSQGMAAILFIREGDKKDVVKAGTLYVKVVGIKGCVDKGSTLDIIFKNGTKTQLVSWKKFNCDGENYFDISSKLDMFKASPISAIRYKNIRNYNTMTVNDNMSSENSTYIQNLLLEIDRINNSEVSIEKCEE